MPKNLSNSSTILLMGFPDCGSSYFLLMELDKDFKPMFKLLETQPDQSVKGHSFNDLSHVMRIKKIDISQMQMLEDELNLSILDRTKLLSFLPGAEGPNQTSEHGLLSEFNLDSSIQIAGCPPSSFSSVVDEVFEYEKGPSAPSYPVQSLSSSFATSSASHFGSLPMNIHGVKPGTPSPKWEAGMQISHLNNAVKVPIGAANYNGSLYSSSNVKGPVQSSSFGSLSSGLGRSAAVKKLSASKSDQDLASLRSPHSLEVGSVEEDLVSGNRSSRLLSPPRSASMRVSAPIVKSNGPRSSPTGPLTGSVRVAGSSSLVSTPICKILSYLYYRMCTFFLSLFALTKFDWQSVPFSAQAADIAISQSSSHDVASKLDKNPRKHTVSDMMGLIPSLQGIEVSTGFNNKKRKISESANSQQPSSETLLSTEMVSKVEGYSYGNLVAEANKGNATSSIYVSTLLHVVRHCSLCIKHARLTSQMVALEIPYVEEVGLRNASSNIWFRLPFARGDTWRHICLRLGRPGSMYWDVKINDQHFRDLWELQKGSNSTPWGSGVRIANTSDVDSHIRYDPEGVVLSYQSVEADSIKKLVADIRRLADARMFAIGMRKLLGVKADEKPEESNSNFDAKATVAGKAAVEAADRLSEQMRRAFRIEAVGLMSLWFSFGSGVLARFVVEWESGKEGCTMHVTPDQLWPHTKVCFLIPYVILFFFFIISIFGFCPSIKIYNKSYLE